MTIAPGYGMRTFEKPDANPPDCPTPATFPTPTSTTRSTSGHEHDDRPRQHVLRDGRNDLRQRAGQQYHDSVQQHFAGAELSAGAMPRPAALPTPATRWARCCKAARTSKISVHHNLYAHQKGRLPRVGSEVGTGAYNDFRNNVFYNWLGTAGSGAGGQPSFNNFVANFLARRPRRRESSRWFVDGNCARRSGGTASSTAPTHPARASTTRAMSRTRTRTARPSSPRHSDEQRLRLVEFSGQSAMVSRAGHVHRHHRHRRGRLRPRAEIHGRAVGGRAITIIHSATPPRSTPSTSG